jgi:hypothetical protein
MREWVLNKSTQRNKKYMVVTPKGNIIHFGARGYDYYWDHRDPKRKKLYDARHKHHEQWNNPYTAGFWAKWLLWNKLTPRASVQDIMHRFRIKISAAMIY